MTIRKGGNWGAPEVVPAGLPIAADDRELFGLINAGPLPAAIAVCRGDLARTVSSSPDPGRYHAGNHIVAAPLDLLEVVHDSGAHRVASHVVARRSWLWGTVVVVANAQFHGRWDIAPRSHPNDGFMDITEVGAAMSIRQRLLAVSRLPTASHLPHPGIRTLRAREHEWRFSRPLDLFLDGSHVVRTGSLRVRVLADALTLFL